MRIYVGDIGYVVTFVLEPAKHAEFHRGWRAVVEKIPRTDSISAKLTRIEQGGRIERIIDRIGPIGTAERYLRHLHPIAVDVVERIGATPPQVRQPRPSVVSLVGNNRLLEHEIDSARVAHSKSDVAFLARGVAVQFDQINAAEPRPRHVDGKRIGPVALDKTFAWVLAQRHL